MKENIQAGFFRSGRMWPVGIVVFFLIIAVMNGTLLYVALSTSTDYIEESPYEKSLTFQEVVEERQAAAEGKWTAKIDILPTGERKQLRLQLLREDSPPPLPTEILSVQAIRPSGDAATDQTLKISPTDLPGVFAAPWTGQKGLWLFVVRFQSGDKVARLEIKSFG